MGDKKREQDILQRIIDVLLEYIQPQKIYLFGSRLDKKHRNGSDFDIAVDMELPSADVLRKIDEELESFMGLYNYDIAYLKSANEDFRHLVLTKGKIIYEE